MRTAAKNLVLLALSAFMVAESEQASQAAVLFDISGGRVPLFTYGTASGDNNVVNVPGQPTANNTGSTIVDPSNTADWIGSIGGSSPSNSVLSVTGLIPGGVVAVQWTYTGSASGDQVKFNTGPYSYTEADLNNNNLNSAHQFDGPQIITLVKYANNIIPFSLTDIQTGNALANGGPNATPNNGTSPSLIFAYATGAGCGLGGRCTLSDPSLPTNTVVFAFSGIGGADSDDFIGIARIVTITCECPIGVPCDCYAGIPSIEATPLPATLPLFLTGLGVLNLLRVRGRRPS